MFILPIEYIRFSALNADFLTITYFPIFLADPYNRPKKPLFVHTYIWLIFPPLTLSQVSLFNRENTECWSIYVSHVKISGKRKF